MKLSEGSSNTRGSWPNEANDEADSDMEALSEVKLSEGLPTHSFHADTDISELSDSWNTPRTLGSLRPGGVAWTRLTIGKGTHPGWRRRIGSSLRRLWRSTWFLIVCLCLLMLIVQHQVVLYRRDPCPKFHTYSPEPLRRQVIRLTPDELPQEVDCFGVFQGEDDVLQALSGLETCHHEDSLVQEDFKTLTKDCSNFRQSRGYHDHVVTDDERDFPLAFNIITYENAKQTEHLLRAIWRPQNYYCIHVDAKSPGLAESLSDLAGCFDNVALASVSHAVTWGHVSVMDAEIACMRDLLQHKKWKYFLNLTGRDFPIRTNYELVQIFKAYQGANDIEGISHGRPTSWTNHIYHQVEVLGYHAMIPTFIPKSSPPHNLTINKGTTHIAASREFVNFAVNDQRSIDLLEWLRDARVPDEMFWSTLNHNSVLNAPGSYMGKEEEQKTVSRVKKWWYKGDKCEGSWIHGICSLGLRDLQEVRNAPQYFINKLHLEAHPLVFHCAEQWYRYRVKKIHNPEFNLTFYKDLPHVKYRLGSELL